MSNDLEKNKERDCCWKCGLIFINFWFYLNVRDMVLLQSPRKEILPDSLRRQYTTNPFSKVFILIYFIFQSIYLKGGWKKC
jgi:hypothetical protein